RTDLLFDDADGIDTLPNQAIFDAIQLMGYEGDLTVLTFNKANGGKITPLFDNMLVQPTQEEGASSERLSEAQPSPSPEPTSEAPNESLPDSSSAQSSEVPFEQQPDLSPSPSPRPSPNPSPTPIVPDSIPEPTGENLGDHSFNDTSLSGNEDAMTLQNVYDLCQDHKAQKESSSCHQTLHSISEENIKGTKTSKETSLKEKEGANKVCIQNKEEDAKKGDGKAKENAQSEGRTKEMMDEDKETDEVGLSTEDEVSTAKKGVSTEFEKVSTDRPKLSTDDLKVLTTKGKVLREVESTADKKVVMKEAIKKKLLLKLPQTSSLTPHIVIFGDDETIATLFINMVKPNPFQRKRKKGCRNLLSIFDREDLNAVYQLVMNKYQDEMPEGFERVLWGDLMVLFNPDEQDEFWGSQQEWKIIKKKYPLKKEILVQMLNLRLESEEESTMALELIRFIKKNKELSIPEQTATGKGTSNPLMAGSLPKTIKPT
ncbi:hypothetical protein Tco_1024178, partial [Tanacetum coccineum]